MKFNNSEVAQSTSFVAGGDGTDRLTVEISDFPTNISFNGGAGQDILEIASAGRIYMTKGFGGDGSSMFTSSFYEDTSGFHSKFVATSGVERFIVKGSELDDSLTGGSGDDYLDGRGGVDRFEGSQGNDTYVLNEKTERVFFEGIGMGVDQIITTVSVDLRQHSVIENLRLSGTEAINGTGNEWANVITGNASSNVIAGGAGRDSLYGKGGADTFAFSELGKVNKDSIWDFGSDDALLLNKAVFHDLDANNDGVLDAGSFHLGTKAVGVGAQILYDTKTGNVFYDADGAGGATAEVFAMIGKDKAFFDHADILIS